MLPQKHYGTAPLRVSAEENIMRVRSLVTVFSVMVILLLAMVPALAQTTQASPTGRDWVWIIGTVALIAAAIWYFMRSDKRA
jgi:Kef-type K+ transport system membrane component KefB